MEIANRKYYSFLTTKGKGVERDLSFSRSRLMKYGIANMLFWILLLFLRIDLSPFVHDPFWFLVILFSLCSGPLFLIESQNGRYCLLVIAGPMFFMFYGLSDLLGYFMQIPIIYHLPAGSSMSAGEQVIVLGIASLYFGYIAGAEILRGRFHNLLSTDWNLWDMTLLGGVFVTMGLFATFVFQISVSSSQTVQLGGQIKTILIIVGRMLEPIGVIILTYTYLKGKNVFILLAILAIAAVKLPIGIVLNSKEIGISFIILVFLTIWIHEGKVPLKLISIILLIVIFYFPISYAYRAILGKVDLTVGQSINKAESLLDRATYNTDQNRQIERGVISFVSRVNHKHLVELIVVKTGRAVRLQKGHTLLELPLFFIPRIIWPGKPSVSVGQLFNREFRISANPNTYISTTFIGEFFWNYGRFGVLFGMGLVGFFLGCIATLLHVRETASAARILIIISGLYLLIFRFESAIAQQTILFIRTTGLITILHLLLRLRNRPDSSRAA